MKTNVKRLIRDEAGAALALTLVLLLVGGLVIAPLLKRMGTGIIAGEVHENRMYELYAADAGVEDAMWHLQDDQRLATKFAPSPYDPQWTVDSIDWPQEYTFIDPINQKQVHVRIDLVWLLDGLPSYLGLPSVQPANDNRWTVTGAINIDYTGNYIIDITTDETDAAYVGHIGVWLPPGYSYVKDSTNINDLAIGEHDLVANPQEIPHLNGTVVVWSFENVTFEDLSNVLLTASGGCAPAEKFPHTVRLSFDYTTTTALPEHGDETFIEAKGFLPWIRLADDRIAWDTGVGVFEIQSRAASDLAHETGTTVETHTLRSMGRYTMSGGGAASAVQGDYIAIGNSLMTSAWQDRSGSSCSDYVYRNPVMDPSYSGTYYVDTCRNIRGSHWQESSVTIDNNAVPQDARIEKAYLYWTAWWWTYGADEEVTLKVNGTPIGAEAEGLVRANKSYVVEAPGAGGYQYSCFADVTRQVSAITTDVNGNTFTVGGVSAVPASESNRNDLWLQAANAGWSMIIIYSSAEKETRQIYLYHDMPLGLREPVSPYARVEFTVTGFRAPELAEGDMGAQVAVFVAEGDAHITPTYMEFKGQQSGDFHSLGDSDTNAPNPYDNVFNAYSTATGFVPSALPGQGSGQISGVDIDAYTKDKDNVPLSDIVQPGDTSATIALETRSDYIMLVYVVFSVRSNAIPAGEGINVGAMTYRIG